MANMLNKMFTDNTNIFVYSCCETKEESGSGTPYYFDAVIFSRDASNSYVKDIIFYYTLPG
jgi:hypothetical protein